MRNQQAGQAAAGPATALSTAETELLDPVGRGERPSFSHFASLSRTLLKHFRVCSRDGKMDSDIHTCTALESGSLEVP